MPRDSQGVRVNAARNERETAINRFDDSQDWNVFTSSPIVRGRLLRLGWEPGAPYAGDGWEFILPLNAVTIRSRKGMERKKASAAGKGFAKVKP